MATLRDPKGVGDGLRKLAEPLRHLGRGLEVELVVVEAHPFLVGDDRTGLQTEKDVMRLGIVLAGVVGVVRGDQRNPGALREARQALVDASLLLHPVVLDLEEVVITEHALVFAGNLLRTGVVTLEKPARHLPAEAAGERDQPLRMLGEQRLVDPRLVVVPLEVRQAGELDQVAVTFQVLDEQDQVVGIAVGPSFLLMARATRDVGLLPDDGVDPGGFRLQVEIDRAIEHAVVGERDRRHPGLDRQADHLGDPARPIEQAELRVSMEMNEAHAVRSSLTTASMW